MLYFSYGSNMSIKRLRQRVPSARVRSVATLYGHELRFQKIGRDSSGKCDAHETSNPAHAVVGVVFEIAEIHKSELDKKEGLGYGYEQKTVSLVTLSGKIITAITYFAIRTDPSLRPFHWYKHHVLTGAMENGLPREYVEKIVNIESIEDPEPERHEREMAIYAGK